MPEWLIKILGTSNRACPCGSGRRRRRRSSGAPCARRPSRSAGASAPASASSSSISRRRISSRSSSSGPATAKCRFARWPAASARAPNAPCSAGCPARGARFPTRPAIRPWALSSGSDGTLRLQGRRPSWPGRMPHASHGNLTPVSLFKVPDGVDRPQRQLSRARHHHAAGRPQGTDPARRPDRRRRPGAHRTDGRRGWRGRPAPAGIIAVAASRRRSASALAAGGADEFVALSDGPDAMARVQADIVIEAVGSARAITLAMAAAAPGGTVVLLGSSRDLGRNLDWARIAQAARLDAGRRAHRRAAGAGREHGPLDLRAGGTPVPRSAGGRAAATCRA